MKTQRVVFYGLERDPDYRDIYPYRFGALHVQDIFPFGSEHYLCLIPPGPLCHRATLPPEIQPPAVLQPYTFPHLEQHPDWRSTTRIPASISQSVRRLRVESHHLQETVKSKVKSQIKKKQKQISI